MHTNNLHDLPSLTSSHCTYILFNGSACVNIPVGFKKFAFMGVIDCN